MASCKYQYEVKSVRAFVQRVACEIANRGYVFYVSGHIPEGKAVDEVDAKLLSTYGIALSKYQRCRRKGQGKANLQYVRHRRAFAMFATPGKHSWFEREQWPRALRLKRGSRIRDLRREPLCYAGYQISVRRSACTGRDHVSVRIRPDEFRGLRAYFLDIACKRSVAGLQWEYSNLPFEPYRGVKKQYGEIARAVNEKRRTQKLEAVSLSALPARRQVVRTFVDVGPLGRECETGLEEAEEA